jgi:hypothetical protein
VYLNSLMGEEMNTDFVATGIAATPVRTRAAYDATSHTLTVAPEAVGARLEIFATDGRLLGVQRIAQTQTSLANVPAQWLLLRISGARIAPVVMKVVR